MIFGSEVAVLVAGYEYQFAQADVCDIAAGYPYLEHEVVFAGLEMFGELISGIEHAYPGNNNTPRYG